MEPHSIFDCWRAMAGMATRGDAEALTILDIGACDGADGVRLAKRSRLPVRDVALEPDPREDPAQQRVLAGARHTLTKTRFLYIECHPEPQHEDEPTHDELLALLPGWELIARWPSDLLLYNTRL